LFSPSFLPALEDVPTVVLRAPSFHLSGQITFASFFSPKKEILKSNA
jgi:hypothetical protein